MANLKLTYFDFHGGRGEPARLALSMGGIALMQELSTHGGAGLKILACRR